VTDEEWERLKDSIRAKESNKLDDEMNESRRKLNRDLDRLERALKAALGSNPQARQRMREEDERWREFGRRSRERFAELSEFAARSDQKLKALIKDIRSDRDKRKA